MTDLRAEKALFVREFLLSEYRSAAAEAEGLPIEREAMPAWDALHELLSILDNETKATRSDEALLRRLLKEARHWLDFHPAAHGLADEIDAALNPPGVE